MAFTDKEQDDSANKEQDNASHELQQLISLLEENDASIEDRAYILRLLSNQISTDDDG